MRQYILLAKIALAIGIIVSAIWIGYKAGKNEVMEEHAKKMQEAVDKAKDDQRDKIDSAAHEAEYWRKIAINMQENPITIIEWRDKIVTANPDCKRIIGIKQLWSQSKQAAGM